MKRYPLPIAALAALTLGTGAVDAQSIGPLSQTNMNNSGNDGANGPFGISVKAGNAKYVQSAAAGGGSGLLGDGTLLDWQIHTAVNGESPFAASTVSAGPGTYFDTPTCADSSVGGPQDYFDVWTTSDIDTEAADITSGTTPAVGNQPTPIGGNIDISTLESGQIYILNGTYRASPRVDLTMTGPGKTPIVMPSFALGNPGSVNRMQLYEFGFTNPGGEYTNIEWSSSNNQNNTGRRRWGGIFLDGTIYVDTVDPTWEAGFPTADPVGSSLFTLNTNVDEASTAYYVVLPDGAAAPTSAQVAAGTDAADAPVALSGNFALDALVETSQLVTGLSASTSYDVYVVAEDVRGPNLQATPVLIEFTTSGPDITPPTWTATFPQVDRTPAALSGISNIDEPGYSHFVVVPAGDPAPTSAQVQAGQDHTGSAAGWSSTVTLLTPTVSGSETVSGLDVSSAYDVWFAAEDLEGNLQAAPVMVASASVAAVDQFTDASSTWGTDSVWSGVTGGPYTEMWGDGNNAVFESGSGTVTVDAGTTVGNITFNSNNWLLTGGPLVLAGATTPTITVNGNLGDFENVLSGTQGLIKEGPGLMRFNSNNTTNTITGGWALNGGDLGDNNGNLGVNELNGNDITTNGASNVGITFRAGTFSSAFTLNAPFTRMSNNNGTVTINGAVTGPGGIELNKTGNGRNGLILGSTANTFTGGVNYTSNRDIDFEVTSFADSGSPGTGNIVFGNGSPQTVRNRFLLRSNAIAPLTLNNRQFELAGSQNTWRAEIRNDSSQAFTINSDLLVSGTSTKDLRLGGNGAGTNTFAGAIGDTVDDSLSLIKEGSGTWVLSGNNTYTGPTTVIGGTLELLGGSQASAITVNSGATLGFTIGSPTTSTAGVTLDAGHKIEVTGTPDGVSDYVLMTASSITGTPALDPAVGGYSLEVQGGGTQLVLVAPLPSTTLVIDLGAGTVIEGGQFIGTGPTNLPIPSLPAGSILRSITYDNVTLTATDNGNEGNYTSDLTVLLDPTPGTPGGDFSLGITSSAANQTFGGLGETLEWSGGNDGVGTAMTETMTDADWAATGDIDLATTGVFLGNAYQGTDWASPQGGTWTGTITLTYDLVDTGSPFETWAGSGTLGEVTFDGDTNNDGVQDGIAFLLGVANPDDDANGNLPTISEDGGDLVMIFNCLPGADRGSFELRVMHSTSLDSWTATLDQVPDADDLTPDNHVTFEVDTVSVAPLNRVTAKIGSAAAPDGRLFGRLEGSEP